MAGFDFEFVYTEDEALFVDACIRVAKARARSLNCSWRTERKGKHRRYCLVSGQTRRLDLLGRVLEMDLPLVCQGVSSSRTPSEAFRLGTGFVNLFLRGRDAGFEEPVQALRGAKETALYYPVYEFADMTDTNAVLHARLYITELMLADFALGRLDGLVLLEELHTAAEQIMREILERTDEVRLKQAVEVCRERESTPRAKQGIPYDPAKMRWPTLRAMLQVLGYFPDSESFILLLQDDSSDVDHTHTPNEIFDKLAKLRNTAKHTGLPDQPWLNEHWECVSSLLEHVVAEVK